MNSSFSSLSEIFWWLQYVFFAVAAYFAIKAFGCFQNERLLSMGKIINPELREMERTGAIKPQRHLLHAIGYGLVALTVLAVTGYVWYR